MKISNIILAVLIGGLGLSMVTEIATAKGEAIEIEGVTLTGKRSVRTYDAIALKHLNIEGPMLVILSAGIPSLKIEADEGLLDELADKDTDPETLSLKLPKNATDVGQVNVFLSTPTLETISIVGSGSVESIDTALPYANNTIRLSGKSGVMLTYSNAEFLRVIGSGGTAANLKGMANRFEAELNGGNSIEAGELIAQVVEISGSGSTNAVVHADSLLSFSASGSSSLKYTGSPKVSFSSAGSGRLEAM